MRVWISYAAKGGIARRYRTACDAARNARRFLSAWNRMPVALDST
jgi:hypothetical protein